MKSKRSVFSIFGFFLPFVGLALASGALIYPQDDLSSCISKVKSEWSRPCIQCVDHSKSYRVYFRNTCDQVLDVKLAAQEKDKRWKTYTFRLVQPGDTLLAYACHGTGKYLYWVRNPEDIEYVFPTEEEINQAFTD